MNASLTTIKVNPTMADKTKITRPGPIENFDLKTIIILFSILIVLILLYSFYRYRKT